MNMPLDGVLIGLATLLATWIAWLVATRAATASRKLETAQADYNKAQVDAEAYERARLQYDAIIAALRDDIVDLRCQVERLKTELAVTSRRMREYERDRVSSGLGPLDSTRQPAPLDPPDREGGQ